MAVRRATIKWKIIVAITIVIIVYAYNWNIRGQYFGGWEYDFKNVKDFKMLVNSLLGKAKRY